MTRPSVAEVLRGLPEPVQQLARALIDAADALGMCVYLVGGPVRDLLLGRSLRDLDFLVESIPGENAESLARRAAADGCAVTTHDRFGTVTLERNGAAVDLAMARMESYAHDGALPTVSVGTLVDDLRRRDFAVNALALPLTREARARYPAIIDLDHGLDDLANRRLRVLHARSFHDDPTRALRAARLAARLGFTLSRSSHSALQDTLRDGAFGHVSGDRLRREIVKLFDDAGLGQDPVRALRLLDDWHVLGALEPGLELPDPARVALRRMGRCVGTPPWPTARWRAWITGAGIWLAPLAPQLRRRVVKRFAIRGSLAQRIVGMGKLGDRVLRALAKARGRGAIDAILQGLPEEELHAIHAWASPAVRNRVVRFAAEDRQRRAPVNGADLTALGLSGPDVGRALARIRVAFLDGAVRSRDEALILAGELGRQGRSRAPGNPGRAQAAATPVGSPAEPRRES
ncbi:MAG: hypothetical protein OEM49_13715 [Myxococcales bacterium]|nr:hypothetical protein [Myxococcales bacterium]